MPNDIDAGGYRVLGIVEVTLRSDVNGEGAPQGRPQYHRGQPGYGNPEQIRGGTMLIAPSGALVHVDLLA